MADEAVKTEPKYAVGQVVILASGKKNIPFRILAMEWDAGWFYAYNRRNYVAESMIRLLTDDETGKPQLEGE